MVSQRELFGGAAIKVTSDMSVDDMLERAGLDWEVDKREMLYGPDQNLIAPVFGAYRVTDNAFIDVYRNRMPWQNQNILDVFGDFCAKAGLEIDHIGFLPEQWKLFATAKLGEFAPPQAVGDITQGWLLLTDSHMCGNGLDGSLFLNRLYCTNGMRRGLKTESKKVISHIGKFDTAKVNRVLDAVWNTFQQEQDQVQMLANESMTYQEAQMLLIKEFGLAGQPWDAQPKRVKTCLQLFDGRAKGADSLAFYNTAYGLLQSVVEHENYYGMQRGTSVDRFASVLSGSHARTIDVFNKNLNSFIKNRTLDIQPVGVRGF